MSFVEETAVTNYRIKVVIGVRLAGWKLKTPAIVLGDSQKLDLISVGIYVTYVTLIYNTVCEFNLRLLHK